MLTNLGPDYLAGLKALDLNYCKQSTLCLEDLIMYGNELQLILGQVISPLLLVLHSYCPIVMSLNIHGKWILMN